jgi:hypothetical protein
MPGDNTIRLVEHDNGVFWIHTTMDGEALTPRGPFADRDEAEEVAFRMAAVCRTLNTPVEIVVTPAARQCA